MHTSIGKQEIFYNARKTKSAYPRDHGIDNQRKISYFEMKVKIFQQFHFLRPNV